MRNANKYRKISYYAMAREVEKWSGIRIRDGLLPKVNHLFRLLDPIITLSFSEIGSQTEWQTNGPDRNNHLHILACNVFYSTAPVCFVHKTFRSTSKSTKWLERFLCVCQPKCNKKTSSSAVTETPRDASCLSVVSFNSTIRRAQSLLLAVLPLQIYCCVN